MSNLDKLLTIDNENIDKIKRMLGEISPDCMEAIEIGTTAFERLGKAWGEHCQYDRYREDLQRWGTEKGVVGDEMLRMLKDATLIGSPPTGDSTPNAKLSLDKGTAVIARTYLMLRLQREFLYGVTDILRLRVTPALGYLRIQTETIGLLKLIHDSPHVAQEWLDADKGEAGKEFFNNHNGQVIKNIRDLNLYEDYNRGSSMALHSRVGGVMAGILIGGKRIEHPGIIQLTYQESDNPTIIFLWFCVFLNCHRRILDQIDRFVPALDADAIRQTNADRFGELVTNLWNILERMYLSYKTSGYK